MTARKRPLVERVALVIWNGAFKSHNAPREYGRHFDMAKDLSLSTDAQALRLARRILRLVAREKKR